MGLFPPSTKEKETGPLSLFLVFSVFVTETQIYYNGSCALCSGECKCFSLTAKHKAEPKFEISNQVELDGWRQMVKRWALVVESYWGLGDGVGWGDFLISPAFLNHHFLVPYSTCVW